MADHFCDQHGKVFFQKGKMKGFAHPLEDDNGETVGWCNEDAEEVAKLPARTPQPIPLAEGEEEVSDEMTKGDWAEKDRIRQKSIQRQTSLKAAVEWCKANLEAWSATGNGERIKTIDILATAKVFESYLESGAKIEKK